MSGKRFQGVDVLYAFGFERIGVVVSDLYFVDPDPLPGQASPERGVRLELRLFERGEPSGSIYAARPITIARPLWRVDLLQDADAAPGTFDRTHHHPDFDGWIPGPRVFVEELSADPLTWLAGKLSDVPGLLKETGISPGELTEADAAGLRAAVPEITDTVRRLLERVWAGELGRPTDGSGPVTSARVSWL
ncbi:hypothetical protein B7P34_24770 [Streptosporangium nondiastaticum]|uniref:Uncharacterized protein n=1 Tax=Streptosporangium nondiastaticum TaxID=35764 RepID=A0A9X7PFG9_9ACTN|nr:hypothetical protein B7P34_24770 [Streptosporangium nondiastaticum]